MSTIPEGWTDDMSIQLPHGVTVEKIVDVVIEATTARRSGQEQLANLMDLGLSRNGQNLHGTASGVA
jgi:hypothetical protein